MSRAEVIQTSEYWDRLVELPSDDVFDRVTHIEELLADFPDMGSPLVRASVMLRYGEDIRKVVVGNYVVFYRHTGNKVYMLTIVPAGAIH